jgi:hypothetical protein
MLVLILLAQADQETSALSSTKTLIEVIAIIVGALWTYVLFVKTRQRYPAANLSHQVVHKKLDANKVLLRVIVTIQNVGKILIKLEHIQTTVYTVLPLSTELSDIINTRQRDIIEGTEIDWVEAKGGYLQKTWTKGTPEVEPGESDQFAFDFILGERADYVIVYSYFRNRRKKRRRRDIFINSFVSAWNLFTPQNKQKQIRERHIGWKAFSTYDLEQDTKTRVALEWTSYTNISPTD